MCGRAGAWPISSRPIGSCCSLTAGASAFPSSVSSTSRSRIREREFDAKHGTGISAAPSYRHPPHATDEHPSHRLADAEFPQEPLDFERFLAKSLQLALQLCTQLRPPPEQQVSP